MGTRVVTIKTQIDPVAQDLFAFHAHLISSTGILRIHKKAALVRQWLDSSVGRALHRQRSCGSNSVSKPEFFFWLSFHSFLS